MLADIVHLAPQRAYGQFSTILSNFYTQSGQASLNVDTIKAVLSAAGWSLVGTTQASASISFPLGFPTTLSGLLITERVAATVQKIGFPKVQYVWFNPLTEIDPSQWNFATATFVRGVPLGGTSAASADNLALKMTEGIWITSLVDGGLLGPIGITFQSALPGTDGNNYDFEGNGGASTGSGLSIGGGWEMQSQSQQDVEPTSTNTTRTTITIHSSSLAVELSVTVDGVDPIDYFLSQGDWEAAANNFTALFFTNRPFHAGDIYVFNSFLFCGSLYIPPELRVREVGFIITGNASFTVGNPILGVAAANTGVDGKMVSTGLFGGWGQQGFSFCFYHYAGDNHGVHHNLQTRMGKSILLPAMVMMPCHPAEFVPIDLVDESRVVGYLWDAFIATEYQSPGALISQESQPYRATFAQVGPTVGTVFLAWPVKPPSEGEKPPVLPDFVGACNVFGFGVTRLTGDPFTSDLEGRVIYINHEPYKVLTVLSANSLNLASSGAGIQANVTYNTAG